MQSSSPRFLNNPLSATRNRIPRLIVTASTITLWVLRRATVLFSSRHYYIRQSFVVPTTTVVVVVIRVLAGINPITSVVTLRTIQVEEDAEFQQQFVLSIRFSSLSLSEASSAV